MSLYNILVEVTAWILTIFILLFMSLKPNLVLDFFLGSALIVTFLFGFALVAPFLLVLSPLLLPIGFVALVIAPVWMFIMGD